MTRSSDLFRAASAQFDAALAEARVEHAASEARVARLRYARELELIGRYDEAAVVIAEIRAEQEACAAGEPTAADPA